MDHFLYRDGLLYAEDVALADIAAAVGTPFYCYSTATLLRHFRLFDEALSGMDHLVCYAMKAASNQAILKTLAAEGAAGAGQSARAAAPPSAPWASYTLGLPAISFRWQIQSYTLMT